jgi:hypothetical protein
MHWFWLRIFPCTWLDSPILTAGCSVCLILTHWIWLSIFEMGLTAGVTGQQRMLTPSRHLILPSHFRRSVLPYTRFCNWIMIAFYTLLTSLFFILWHFTHAFFVHFVLKLFQHITWKSIHLDLFSVLKIGDFLSQINYIHFSFYWHIFTIATDSGIDSETGSRFQKNEFCWGLWRGNGQRLLRNIYNHGSPWQPSKGAPGIWL